MYQLPKTIFKLCFTLLFFSFIVSVIFLYFHFGKLSCKLYSSLWCVSNIFGRLSDYGIEVGLWDKIYNIFANMLQPFGMHMYSISSYIKSESVGFKNCK